MQPTTNGNPNSVREMLDSVRHVVEQLEAEVQKQREQIKQLQAERDEYRMMISEIKRAINEREEWERFDPAEYTVTIDDLLADLRSM